MMTVHSYWEAPQASVKLKTKNHFPEINSKNNKAKITQKKIGENITEFKFHHLKK